MCWVGVGEVGGLDLLVPNDQGLAVPQGWGGGAGETASLLPTHPPVALAWEDWHCELLEGPASFSHFPREGHL